MKKYLFIILLMRTAQTSAQENEFFVRTQTEYQSTHFVPRGQYHYKKMTLEGRFNFDEQSSVAMLTGIQIGPRKLYCIVSMGILFGKHEGFIPQIKVGMNGYGYEVTSVSEYVFGLKQNKNFALHSLTALWISHRKHFCFGAEEELRYVSTSSSIESVATHQQQTNIAVGPIAKWKQEHFFAEVWYGFGFYGSSQLHMGVGYAFE